MNGLSGLGGGPQIRAQFPPPDGAMGRFLNADGKLRAGGPLAANDLVKARIRPQPKGNLQRLDIRDSGAEVHTKPSVVQGMDYASRNRSIPKIPPGPKHLPMTKWPYHLRLKEALQEYSARTGLKHDQIAEALGVTRGSLRAYAYGTKKPGIKFLQSAASLFGCSVTVFVDDPGGPQVMPDLDPQTAFMGRELTGNLAKLPPRQRQAAFEIAMAAIRGLKE